MKKFLSIYLICFSISLVGQTNLDSLFHVWNNSNQSDTTRLEAIHSIVKNGYLFSQPDSAFYYAQLQYDFAKEKGLQKQMALALNTQGVSFSIRGDYTNAIIYHNRSLKIREEINYKKGIVSSLINIGNVYYEQSNYDNAIKYYNKGLVAAEKVNNKKGIASTLNNLGIIYKEQGNYIKSIEYFKRSLKIKEEINDHYGIANSLGNLGVISSSQGEYDKAIEYFNRGLKIQEKIRDKRGIAGSLMNIGGIYNVLGASAKENGNTTLSSQNYSRGINYSKRALVIAKEVGAVIEIRDAAMNLYQLYKHNGDYKLSLKMYELYINSRDSIESIETQRQVIQQEFKYQYDKKTVANKIIFLKQQKKDSLTHQKERYTLIGGFSLLLILLGVYLRIRYIRKQAEKEILLQEIKLLKAETVVKIASSNTTDNQHIELNKEKIEAIIGGSLNPSDWNILNTLYHNPVISNKEIALQVSLSIDGVRSSLRKMYRLFDIQKTNENQRIALVIKATRISNDSLSQD